MVGIVIRKSAAGLKRYFARDFDSLMWTHGREDSLVVPRVGALVPRKADLMPWRKLSLEEFLRKVDVIDDRRKEGGVLAVELGFAGPKSVSICSLAGPTVSEAIIADHRSAVDDALAFISPLLTARAGGELIPCGVELMEFPHPWNRASEPQLHSHIVMLRDREYSHALWTTPIFMLQRTLREVYHYSLCSRLLRQGLMVSLDQPGTLAWELSAVPADLLRVFSERSRNLKKFAMENPHGYFSQGAEFRVAGWASRRHLPKTAPSVTLLAARKVWEQKMAPLQQGGESVRVDTGPIALDQVFRMSAVLTRQQFVGAHLRWWLGSALRLHEAAALAGDILDNHVYRGVVLHSGEAYCWPESLDAENAILSHISSSFGSGLEISVTGNTPLRKSAKRQLASDSGIKIISTDGETTPAKSDLRTKTGKPFKGIVKSFRRWQPGAILREIENRNGEHLVIFVEEPVSAGDFGARVGRALKSSEDVECIPEKPFDVGRRRVVVHQGEPLRLEKEKTRPNLFERFRSLLPAGKRPALEVTGEAGVVLASHLTDDQLREANWHRLSSEATRADALPTTICRPASWDRLTAGDHTEMGIFAFRNTTLNAPKNPRALRTIRQGSFWQFSGLPQDGMLPVVGLRRKKVVSLEALKDVLAKGGGNLCLVELIAVRLRPGTPLTSPARYESGGQVFHPGQVFIVEGVDSDGRVLFKGGTSWPGKNVVMMPAFYVREFSRKQHNLPAIAIHAGRDMISLKTIETLPPARMTSVWSTSAQELCGCLSREIGRRAAEKKPTATHRIMEGNFSTGLEPMFPEPAVWQTPRNELASIEPTPISKRKQPVPPDDEIAIRSPGHRSGEADHVLLPRRHAPDNDGRAGEQGIPKKPPMPSRPAPAMPERATPAAKKPPQGKKGPDAPDDPPPP
jgi:hypothetical protein